MTQAVIFETPELIDIRSFTTFGINTKPLTQNPIGYFGTGLKYAIATLVRKGMNPILYIGFDKHTFFTQQVQFRDKEFPIVRMRREKRKFLRHTMHDLPFTTELGKNWEVWQAFRELESNTRDEMGETILADDFMSVHCNPQHTYFIVEGEEFIEAYHNRNTIFLPDGLRVREEGIRVQILDRPSKHLYYRGLRVQDLKKPSIYTYNFLSQLELTEDRTLKHEWQARTELARQIVQSDDERMIETILTAKSESWEEELEFEYQSDPPSDSFRKVIERRKGAVSRQSLRYYGGFAPPLSKSLEETTWSMFPRPWTVDSSGESIFDSNNQLILRVGYDVFNKYQFLTDICDLINNADPDI